MLRQQVEVGGFLVDDLDRRGVVDLAVDLAVKQHETPVRAYALHVAGLNNRTDAIFVDEMRRAELVYADGGSVVALGKLSGASRLTRSPTTDVGWDILRSVSERLGHPARIALIGGRPGLALRAGAALARGGAGELVFFSDGYQEDWAPVLQELCAADVDVCIVGLGAPREMLWVREWFDHLPPALVLTCGGWFSFIAGEEKRAPKLLRRSGLEWIARASQAPRRLGSRYLFGMWSTALLALQVLGHKLVR